MGKKPKVITAPLATATPAASVFGAALPTRNIASPGPVVEVTTLAALRTAIASGVSGRTVRLTAPISGTGDLVINCVGTATAPITIDLAAAVSGGLRVVISRAAYVNVRFTRLSLGNPDGLKITDGSHHIDVDGRGGIIEFPSGQGILITDTATHDWQIWNTRINRAGTNANLDHGIYAATAKGQCVIGNVIVTDPQAYGYQIYPDCQGLLITSCETHGSKTRGGMVVGSENGLTNTTTVVGLIATEMITGYGAVSAYPPSTTVNLGSVYDSIGTGAFATQMHPLHCSATVVDPKGYVAEARYPYHPISDIDGKPFVTADAGAVAL